MQSWYEFAFLLLSQSLMCRRTIGNTGNLEDFHASWELRREAHSSPAENPEYYCQMIEALYVEISS